MSFKATVYKILVASPGDVQEERQAIPEVIAQWNALNAESKEVVLLPIKWETHSAPLLGSRPQSVINEQVVHGCDMLIGVFWTRLGTPTGASESGTVEEIEWFINNSRPVMLYFASRPMEPAKLDLDQFKKLRDFQERMRKVGLTGAYESTTDFREKLLGQISINVDRLLAGKSPAIPNARQADRVAKEIKTLLKAGTVYIEDYEKDGVVKSIVVKGDSKSIKEPLKQLGGRWNPTLKGWTFPKSKEIQVAEVLKGVSY